MIAVCDAEFLIFLSKLSLLNKFLDLYETYITDIVKDEVLIEGKPGYSKLLEAINIGKIKVVKIEKDEYFDLMITNGIGSGEASSIALAKKISGILFSDDKRARKTARKYGIEIKGLLGLIQELCKNNLISREDMEYYLNRLIEEGFWIKRELLEKIKNSC